MGTIVGKNERPIPNGLEGIQNLMISIKFEEEIIHFFMPHNKYNNHFQSKTCQFVNVQQN
jgi:hypothetical protein